MPKYVDYEKMIIKLAHKHAQVDNTFEDMIGVGQIAFCKAMKVYDPEKGAFSTILYRTVSSAMIDEYRKNKKHVDDVSYDRMAEVEEMGYTNNVYEILPHNDMDPSRMVELADDISQLSDPSKEVLKVVFECHKELFEETKSLAPKLLRGALTRILRKKNFTWDHITASMTEIKTAVEAM